MALRPELEAKVRACEDEARKTLAKLDELGRRIAEVNIEDVDEAIPVETFDDPSVVRHAGALQQSNERLRRASESPPLRRVASGYQMVRPRPNRR